MPEIKDEMFGQPTPAEQKEAGEAAFYSLVTGIPEDVIFEDLPGARKNFEKAPKNIIDAVRLQFELGGVQNDMFKAYHRKLLGDDSPELQVDIDEYERKTKELLDRAKFHPPRNIAEKAVYLATNMTPGMLEGFRKAIPGAVALGTAFGTTAAIAGQAGPQVLAPEELVTVPVATAAGAAIGATQGIYSHSYMVESGELYRELLSIRDEDGQQLDPEIARKAATTFGSIAGIIEAAQFGTLAKSIPGLSTVTGNVLTKMARRLAMARGLKTVAQKITTNARRRIAKIGLQYVGGVAENVAEEVAQDMAKIVGQEYAKAWDEEHSNYDKRYTRAEWNEIGKQLLHTASDSALAMAILGVPGLAKNTAVEVAQSPTARRELNRMKNILSNERGNIVIGSDDPDLESTRRLRRDIIADRKKVIRQAKGVDNVVDHLVTKGYKGVEVPKKLANTIKTYLRSEREAKFKSSVQKDAERAMLYKGLDNGSEWYRTSGIDTVLEGETQEEALRFFAILAYTSAQSDPHVNLSKAIRVWDGHKRGISLDELFETPVVNTVIDNKMRSILERDDPLAAFNTTMDDLGREEGPVKVRNFSLTLQRATQDPDSLYDATETVNDFRMSQYYLDDDRVMSGVRRERMEDRMIEVRDYLREHDDAAFWTADRVQAALWHWVKEDRLKRGLDPSKGESVTYLQSLRRRAREHYGIEDKDLTDTLLTAFVQLQLVKSPEAARIFDHYSKPDMGFNEIQYLDPESQGTGQPGREFTRQIEPGKDRPQVVHVYKANTQAERQFWSGSRYRVIINNARKIYDLGQDPNGYRKRFNIFEKADPKTIGDMERKMILDGFLAYNMGSVTVFFSPVRAYRMHGYTMNISPSVEDSQINEAREAGKDETVAILERLRQLELDGRMDEFQEAVLADAEEVMADPTFDILRLDPAEGRFLEWAEFSLEGIVEAADEVILAGKIASYLDRYQQDSGYFSKILPGDKRPPEIPKNQAPSVVLTFPEQLSAEQRIRLQEMLTNAGIKGSTYSFTHNAIVLDHVPLLTQVTKKGKVVRKHDVTVQVFNSSIDRFVNAIINQDRQPGLFDTVSIPIPSFRKVWKRHTVVGKENYGNIIQKGKDREKALGITGAIEDARENLQRLPEHIRARENIHQPTPRPLEIEPEERLTRADAEKQDKEDYTLEAPDQQAGLEQGTELFLHEENHRTVYFQDINKDGDIVVTDDFLGAKERVPTAPGKLTRFLKRTWDIAVKTLKSEGGFIGGFQAETSNVKKLEKAEAMEAQGFDSDAIWRATGWLRGIEGLWRFEIDDSKAELNLRSLKNQMQRGRMEPRMNLKDILTHEELYNAYPELRDIEVVFVGVLSGSAAFDPQENEILLKWDNGAPGNPLNPSHVLDNPVKIMEDVMHEVQHAIQDIEGFAQGGSPSLVSMSEIERAQYELEIVAPGKEFTEQDLRKDVYRRLAGEIEARDVTSRRMFTVAGRQLVPPYSSEMIPRSQWVVQDGDGRTTSFSVQDPAPKRATRVAEEISRITRTKARIRAMTGQRKVGETMIPESKALAESLRRAARAAREALREGRKLGIDIERVKLENLKGRQQQRVAKLKEAIQREKDIRARLAEGRRERAYLNKVIALFERAKKALPKLSPEEKGPLTELLNSIDLATLSEKKKANLSATRNWLSANPEAELPDSVMRDLERLDKQPIRQMTIDDVQAIEKTVRHYLHLAATKKRIKAKRAAVALEQARETSIEEMKPRDDVADEVIQTQRGFKETIKDKWQAVKLFFTLYQDHFDLITELLAGPLSTMHDILYLQVKDGINRQLQYRQDTYRKFVEDLGDFNQRFGIGDINRWLQERVRVGRFNLTRGERMAMLRHAMHPDNRRALLEGGFGLKGRRDPNEVFRISEDELNEILNSLDDAELAYAQAPVTNLFDEQGRLVNEVFREKNGYDMELIDTYYPKEVMPLERGGVGFEEASTLERLKGKFVRPGVPKGMLKERIGSEKPIFLNSIERDIAKSVNNAAAYIGLEIPISNASKLLYDPDFRKELTARYGHETWREVEKGLRDIALEQTSYDAMERGWLTIRANVTKATLGINPWVMAKQAMSLPLFAVYVNPFNILKGTVQAMLHPKATEARHAAYSPGYLERKEAGFSRDVNEVYKAANSVRRLWGGPKVLSEKIMAGIQFFDRAAVVPGMEAAVIQALDEFKQGRLSTAVATATGITDADLPNLSAADKMRLAYRFADFVVERTQPMFNPEHRNTLSRGSTLTKMFTMYSSFTNQGYNLIRRTYAHGIRTGEWTPFAMTMFNLFVVNFVGIYIIDRLRDWTQGRDRETTPEDLLKKWFSSAAGYVLFVRDIVSRAITGFDVDTPITKILNDIGETIAGGISAMGETNKKKKRNKVVRTLDRGVETILTLFGIPYGGPKRLIQGVAEKVKDI